MTVLIAIIMALAAAVGVVATLFTLPGIWLMIAVAAALDLWRPETFSIWTLVAAIGLGVLAELIELVAAGAGAKKAGGARRSAAGAIIGAIIGAIVGTPFMPVIGTILGAAVGAGVVAALLERTKPDRTWADSARVGQGAAVGRLVATAIKTLFAVVIAVTLVVAAIA